MTEIRTADGAIIDVSPEEATYAIQKGQAQAEGVVQLVRGNEVGEVDAADLPTALAQGWEAATPDQQRQAKVRAEQHGIVGDVRGGAEAFARGASLGLSDAVARGLGADAEAMQARRAQLGGGAQALELLGGAAPAFVSGGASAAGTAARLTAATPAGAAARLGLAAARGAGGGKVRQMAVQGAVEGFLQGAGAEVSEAALGDTDLAAERVLAGGFRSAGLGGLLGGGTALGGLGLAKVARGGERVSRDVLERVAGMTDDAADPGVRAAMAQGGNLVERAQHAYLRSVGATDNAQAGLAHLHKLSRGPDGAQLLELAKSRSSYADAVGERVAKVWGRSDTSKAVQRFERAFADDARTMGSRAAADRVAQLEVRLNKMARPGSSKEAKALAADVKKILVRSKGEAVHMSHAVHKLDNPYQWLTKTNDELDGILAKHAGKFGSEEVAFHAKQLREIADDGLLWGSKAPGMRTLLAAREAEQEALKSIPAKARKVLESGGFDADTAKTLAKYPEKAAALLDARSKVADALEMAGEDVAEVRRGLDDVRLALAFRDELEQAGEAWRAVKAFEASPGNKRAGSVLAHGATLAGGAFGGIAGALGGRVIGEVLSSAARPTAVLSTLGRLRQTVDKVAGREAAALGGIERLAEGGVAAIRKAGQSTAGAGRAAVRLGRVGASKAAREEGKPTRQVALEQLRRTVVQLASRPEALPEQMGQDLHEVRQVAPKLAHSLMARASRAVSFLASKAPVPYAPPFTGTEIVDPVALERWGRYVDAVRDPLGAVERIERGGLALEHAEALRAVYPSIFRELQTKTLETVGRRAQSGKPVSHQARMQLGLLLGLPLDQALRPGFTQRLQAAGQVQAQQQAGEVRAAGSTAAPTAARTNTDRLEAGGMR